MIRPKASRRWSLYFLALGIVGLLVSGWMHRQAWGSLFWPETVGALTYVHYSVSGPPAILDLTYSYTVDQHNYASARVQFGSDRLAAQHYIDRLTLGDSLDRVPVYYDPRQPEQAVLRRGLPLADWLVTLSPALLLLLGLISEIVSRRRTARDEPNA